MRYFAMFVLLGCYTTLNAQNNDSITINNSVYDVSKPGVTKSAFYGLSVFTENDFLSPFAPNLDDNYTGGLKVDFITNKISALRLGKTFRTDKWDVVTQNVSYGLTVFTPQDLARPTIITTDRPYACYSFFSVGSSFVKQSSYKKIVGYELFVGEMGTQVGNKLQSKIHREHWFGTQRPVPQGWHNQIANGGALAINLRVFQENNIFETVEYDKKFRWLQGSFINELNVGQYLINYAPALRLNLLNINNVFGKNSSGNQSSPLPTIIERNLNQSAAKKTNFNFNLYLTPRVRLVAHNATLTGKLLNERSVYTVSPSQMNRVLFEYDMGFNLRYHFFNAGYNLNGRSKEFHYEDKQLHNWGGFYVSFVYSK